MDKTCRLTEEMIRNAQIRDKCYKMGDGGRLYLFVLSSGQKSFRFIWKLQGKQLVRTLGNYPEITLEMARRERDNINGLIAQGVEAGLFTKSPHLEYNGGFHQESMSFADVMNEWYNRKTTQLASNTRRAKLARLERHVIPLIGSTAIQDLTFRELAAALVEMEKKDIPEMVRRVAQDIKQIFSYAKLMGYIEVNIANDLQDVISLPRGETHRAAITDPDEIVDLLFDIKTKTTGCSSVRYALRIMPYVFVRSRELRMATWDEIDLDAALWIIPANHMKKKGSISSRLLLRLWPCSASCAKSSRAGVVMFFHRRQWRGSVFPEKLSLSVCAVWATPRRG